ncbi:putative carboxypeptidase B-like protein [Penaeus vannamei]|uniref:Putative carboxypeptidase B-like protein n=1 Tax=Penaeus vannamei TaxID=6689 RepID=A0A3R7PS69_PENVA|nr:putative carboxypeptidase B-like protein [Penaeus vannamei]
MRATTACAALLALALVIGSSRSLPLEENRKPRSEEGIVSYSGYKLFRTDVPLPQLPVVDSLDSSDGVDVWSWRYNDQRLEYELDVLTPPDAEQQVKQVFSDYQLNYQEVIEDLQSAINLELGDKESFWNRPGHPMTWERYHSTEDRKKYPAVSQTVLHHGYLHRNRYPHFKNISKSSTALAALSSKRGMGVPCTAMFILHRLVEFNWEDHEIINEFDWYILPLANPDGYEYTRHHDRLWRKTRSINPEMPGCVGVDANRNFGYRWMEGGSSSNPCSDIYAGPTSFSEPETRAIRDFLLKVYLSIHAYSQMWMLPWGFSQERPENYNDMYEVALNATAALEKSYGTKYRIGSIPELLYVATGGSGDYALGAVGIPYSFSLELRDLGRYGFILPREQIMPTANETYVGIKAMAQAVFEKLQVSNNTNTGA